MPFTFNPLLINNNPGKIIHSNVLIIKSSTPIKIFKELKYKIK